MSARGVAVVGSGAIAEQHLAALRELPEVRLVGVSSRTEARARAAGERFGCRWTTDYRALLGDPEVDLVDVVTSSGSHARIALEALAAGKHVLVEKPMAMNAGDARRMIAEARARNRVLSVVSQRRFEEPHAAVRRALDAGLLGRLLLIEASVPYYRTQAYYDSADWRGTIAEDGGALMNQGIHSVDLMLWFAGPARSVIGRTATQTHRMEAEDLALGIVSFESGAWGTVMATTSAQPGFAPVLRLYGEKGTIWLEGALITHWTVPGAPEPPRSGGEASAGVRDPRLSNHRFHQAQIRDVLEAIERGRPPAITGEDGFRAVALVEALYASAARGGEQRVEAP
jgi:predicted dehydrogenase